VISVLCIILPLILPKGSWITRVNGVSMAPTLADGQIVYVDGACCLERGDIVTLAYFDCIIKKEQLFIKRIIGLPGDFVKITDSGVYINHIFYEEDYLTDQQRKTTYGTVDYCFNEVQLKDDEYYVLGDNRDHSFDSRNFGPVLKENIRNKQSERFTVNFLIKSLLIVMILCLCFLLYFILDQLSNIMMDRIFERTESKGDRL
jgi:signal peptidase I